MKMVDLKMSRRRFGLGAAALGTGLLARPAWAQQAGTHSITTSLGTYDIPDDPQRVICIDSRLDLEPALALGLNVIGHAYDKPWPWVPAGDGLTFVGEAPDLEKVLALDPDLIICTDVGDGDSEWWPINRLKDVAPVLPPPYTQPWKQILAQIGEWTGRTGAADAKLAEYDALIADIKARRAAEIATKKIVFVQPWDDSSVYLQSALTLLQPQVLADLGARTAAPAESGDNEIAAENYAEYFGDVDGIIYVLWEAGEAGSAEKNPLWARLPAVAAGHVLKPIGNTNYGGVYTAIHIAQLIDELYGMLA
jgi:iron complex transport system substrate-binding protein